MVCQHTELALTIVVLFPCRCLAAVGYDPVYGARPVKRAIQRELETPLAQALLRGQFEVRSSTHFQGHQPAVVGLLQWGHVVV